MDLALNNLQNLICYKNQSTNQYIYIYIYIYIYEWGDIKQCTFIYTYVCISLHCFVDESIILVYNNSDNDNIKCSNNND